MKETNGPHRITQSTAPDTFDAILWLINVFTNLANNGFSLFLSVLCISYL